MNQNIKAYIKFGIILLGILLLLPKCQQDDAIVPSEIAQEKRLKRISLDKLTSNIGNTTSYRDLSALFDVNKKHSATDQKELSTTSNVWINTDEIVMIQGEALTYYTFVLETNAVGNQFYNLVAAIDNQGTIQSMRILEYTPNEAWLTDTTAPFTGTLKLVQNTFFTTADIATLLQAELVSNTCAIGMNYRWECDAGEEHRPNTCTAGGSEVIIFVVYGPCPETLDPGSSGGGGDNNSNNDNNYPIDPNGNSGGGTSDDGMTPNPDGTPVNDEPCIVDANGNCLGDETTPMPPLIRTVDEKNCAELKKLFKQPNYSIPSPYKSPIFAVSDLQNRLNSPTELGYTLSHNNDLNALASVAPVTAYNYVKYRIASSTIGGAHLHQDDGKSFPMFSGEDIMQLLQFKNAYNNGSVVDPSLFVHVLVSNQGTYAIKINDATKLQQLQPILDDYRDANGDGVYEYEDFVKSLASELQEFQDKYTEKPNGNERQYQRVLLKFIENFDGDGNGLGVSLYKMDGNLTTWNKIILNGNGVATDEPCN